MLLSPSTTNPNNYLFLLLIAIISRVVQCQDYSQSNNAMIGTDYNNPLLAYSPGIYGVRWSLGDYFAYSNLIKTHQDYPNRTQYPSNTNYYVVAFNSEDIIMGDIFLNIQRTDYTCSHREIDIQNTNDHASNEVYPNSTLNSTHFHMYRCYINTDFTTRPPQSYKEEDQHKTVYYQYPYTIYTIQPEFVAISKQTIDNKTLNRKIITNRKVLFESSFRPPFCWSSIKDQNQEVKQQKSKLKFDKNILVIGDWGIIDQQVKKTRNYIPVFQPVIKRVDEDKSLVLAIFLGDLGYDLIGQKYSEMMKYIEPVTSRIAFMTTPGNHDYIYHQDSFKIYAQTFLTPEWNKYYNFYYTFVLGDLLFINYSPPNVLINKQINMNALQYIQQDLNSVVGSADFVSQQYHVIVFSHYPIFCSKANDGLETCTRSVQSYKQYMNTFLDLGMDLYLSGHLHYYQRTYGICWSKLHSNFTTELFSDHELEKQGGNEFNSEVYSEKCPIFLIEGVAGNSYFEESEGANELAYFTSKIVAGTGFGVLSIFSQETRSRELHYTHYRMITATSIEITDKVIKKLPALGKNPQKNEPCSIFVDTDLFSARVWEMVTVLTLIIIGSAICCCFGIKFVKDFGFKNERRHREHVDMVEQNFGAFSSIKQTSQAQHKEETEQDHH